MPIVIVTALSACFDAPRVEPEDTSPSDRAVQEVLTYRSCSFAPPGELIAMPRTVSGGMDPFAGAIAELVKGVNPDEAAKGCTSFFSTRTQNALRDARRSETADTAVVDFIDLTGLISDTLGAKSFLPPGIMAEITWTIFRQFQDIDAIRFSINGDEQAFWRWLAGPDAPAQVFTRADWEQV